MYIAPPSTIDNFLGYFINKNAPNNLRNRLKVSLHMTSYGVNPDIPQPTANDVASILTQFHTKKIDDKFLDEDIITVTVFSNPNPARDKEISTQTTPKQTAPPPPPMKARKPAVATAVALYDYSPDGGPEMLATAQGEKFTVINSSADDWWKVTNSSGKSGWVPASYMMLN